MTTPSADDAGQRLGRYTLFGEIAAGGMATVCFGRLAGEAGFAKTVAIKRLHPQFARDDEFREMFVEEARLAARIRHPNVAPTLDVVAEGGELFLVMEYVHGESLSRLLRTMRAAREPVPIKIAAAVLSGVLHGLHAAHEAKSEQGEPLNLVHRDVSPQNVLVGVDGVARVIDFGIAKAKSSAQTTREGEVRGKLPYMAPEQLGVTPASRRTDIYAAAVILWEMLAGRRLFEAEDERVVYAQIVAGAHEAPSTFADGIAPELDAAVMRGLAKDPGDRFASAREMALAIEEATPLATHSQVGAWVDRVAREALASRGQRLARVESAMSTSDVAAVGRPAQEPPPARSARPPPSVRPPPSARPPPASGGPITGLPPPDIDPMGPPRAGLAARPLALEAPAEKRSRGTGAIVALGLLLAASVGGYVGVPALVERTLVARAREHGMTLVISDVSTSLHSVRLRGVELTAPSVPGARVSARNVDLALDGLSVARITADETDFALDGAIGPTLAALDAFRRANLSTPTPALKSLVGENVRLRWERALGDPTSIIVENAHLEVTRDAARELGEDFTLSLGLVKAETPVGAFGPYGGTVTRDGTALHGMLRLDPTGAANLDASRAADGTVTARIDASPLTLADLGFPAAFGSAQVLGTARWTSAGAAKVDAKIDLTLRGVTVAGAPGDMRVEAEATGDARRVLPLTGAALTFEGVRAPVSGTFDATAGLRVEARAVGPRRTCPGDAPAQLVAELVLDSRRLEEARGKMTSPGRCGAKRGTP